MRMLDTMQLRKCESSARKNVNETKERFVRRAVSVTELQLMDSTRAIVTKGARRRNERLACSSLSQSEFETISNDVEGIFLHLDILKIDVYNGRYV